MTTWSQFHPVVKTVLVMVFALALLVTGLAVARAVDGSTDASVASEPAPTDQSTPKPTQPEAADADDSDVTTPSPTPDPSPSATVEPPADDVNAAPPSSGNAKPAKPVTGPKRSTGGSSTNASGPSNGGSNGNGGGPQTPPTDLGPLPEPGYQPISEDQEYSGSKPGGDQGDEGRQPPVDENTTPGKPIGVGPAPAPGIHEPPVASPSSQSPAPSQPGPSQPAPSQPGPSMPASPEPSGQPDPGPSTPPPAGPSQPPVTGGGDEVTECNDGIDNDGDGWVDWQYDLGCYGPGDTSERAQPRDQEDGWTTFDRPVTGTVYYVSSSTGSDSNDGLTPQTAFASLQKAFERYRRDGVYNDYILLRRGDVFATPSGLNWDRYSGKSKEQPFIIASYGDSTKRPVIEIVGGKTILGALKHRYFVGLDFYFPVADPNNPRFDAVNPKSGHLSMSDNHDNLLFEDVRLRYGTLTIQGAAGSVAPGYAQNIQVRRSQLAYAWSDAGCPVGREQGMYMHNAKNVLIEEVLFLYGGWGKDLPEGYGCANMFNHNLYVTSLHQLTIKDSAFLHGSSIGIKLSAFHADETENESMKNRSNFTNSLIENNFISDSEIGISAGGNGILPERFINLHIKDNVFSELGSDNASDRKFHWGLEVTDQLHSQVTGNYFIDSYRFTNSFGLLLGRIDKNGGSDRDLLVADNTFYDYVPHSVQIRGMGTHQGVTVQNNRIITSDDSLSMTAANTCLMNVQTNDLKGVTLKNNQYRSARSNLFCADGVRLAFSAWQSQFEPTATLFTGEFVDPGRTLTTYAHHLGYTSEHQIEQAMLNNSRLTWDPRLTGGAVAEYVKEGFVIE